MDERLEQKLGDLICKLNPYSHEMDIFVGDPVGDPAKVDFKHTSVEIDTQYPGSWDFKQTPHRINTALRIKYRYPVRKKKADGTHDPQGKILYWLEDYLLVGYEGAGGP